MNINFVNLNRVCLWWRSAAEEQISFIRHKIGNEYVSSNRRRKARSLREFRFSALRVLVVLDPEHSEMPFAYLLPIFLLLQTASTTERCSVGGDNNPDNLQNLYIVSCDADGMRNSIYIL